jgi:RNA polymerase sigma-70 factor, ECF subfamily
MTIDPAFFEKHYGRILSYLLSMVRNSAEAEDLTQEAFLRAYREIDSVKDPEAMPAWLYRIATNVAVDRLRQRASLAGRQAGLDPAEIELSDPEALTLEKGLEQREMTACVQRFLTDIPDSYRSVILLHDLHGLSGPEIAKALGIALPTVKIRLHRARLRLRATLEAGCKLSYDQRGILVCEPRK